MSVEIQRQAFSTLMSTVKVCYGVEFLSRPPNVEELKYIEWEISALLVPGYRVVGLHVCQLEELPQRLEGAVPQSTPQHFCASAGGVDVQT